MPMPLTPLDTAAGASTLGGSRPTIVAAPAAVSRKFPDAPAAGPSPSRTSCASWPKLTVPPTLGRSAPFCAAKAFTRPFSATGAGNARRGPKIAEPTPLAAELALSRKDNVRLTLRLARAEAIIELQKNKLGSAARL